MKTFNLHAIFILISSLFFVHSAQAELFNMEGHGVMISEEASQAMQDGFCPIYLKKNLKDFQSQDLFKITAHGLNRDMDLESTRLSKVVRGYQLIGFGRPDSVVFDIYIYGKKVDADHLSHANEESKNGPYKFLKGHILDRKGQKRIEVSYTLKIKVMKGELKDRTGQTSLGFFDYYLVEYTNLIKNERPGFDFHTRDENGKVDSYANYILINY